MTQQKQKILVIGGSSFIGQRVVEDSLKRGFNVVCTYFSHQPEVDCATLQLNILDGDVVKNAIGAITPDVIVLCSAESSVDEGQERYDSLNVQGVQNVVEVCKNMKDRAKKIKVVFMSTSYVFSGENGPYSEDDKCKPIQAYGRSKVEAEKIVQELENYAIIRPSVVYGWPKKNQHNNIVVSIIEKMNIGKEFAAHGDVFRTPVFIGEVTETILTVIEKNARGIFHAGSSNYISVYDFAKEICEVFELNYASLTQDTFKLQRDRAPRPQYAGVLCAKTQEVLNIRFKTTKQGLQAMKEEKFGKMEQENQTQVSESQAKVKETEQLQSHPTPEIALVTGGAGFIGSHLVEALVEEGFKVRVLDSLVKGKLQSIQSLVDQGKVEFIEGDVKNKDIVDDCMENVSYVFHTAGIHIKRSGNSPDDCIESNIKGSYNVFHSALKHNVKRVIFSSSSSVYGDPKKLPMHEDDQLFVAEPYGASKLFCEHLLQHLAKKGLKYNALRYYNVYGERQAAHAYYTTVVTHFIKRIMNNEPPTIDGKGDQSMDFTHVSDVVRANILAMRSEAVNEEFNVGTGISTSVAQLADIIIKALGKDIQPIFREREVLVTRRQADTTKAEQLLGFKAQVRVEEGLSQVAREIANNPDKY